MVFFPPTLLPYLCFPDRRDTASIKNKILPIKRVRINNYNVKHSVSMSHTTKNRDTVQCAQIMYSTIKHNTMKYSIIYLLIY